MTAAFERAYRSRFSFLMPGRPIIIEAVSVAAVAPNHPDPSHPDPSHPDPATPTPATPTPSRPDRRQPDHAAAAAARRRRAGRARAACSRPGRRSAVPLYRRRELPPGQAVDGPAIIAEDLATTVVEPGWRASITDRLDLLLTRVGPDPATATRATTEADPVLLEVFGNLFMAVAEQMGERLRSTAHSVNIKERLDFSCAIFDADGGLIANAPHIPVHLGSMGESIKMVIRPQQGPHQAGRRLRAQRPLPRRHPPPRRHRGHPRLPRPRPPPPRTTRPGRPTPWFYVASRGHHAEIGGMSPGSMPAASTRIEEEGVLIDNWLLVENGRLREDGDQAPAHQRRIPVEEPGHQPGGPAEPRSPPTRRASRSCAGWSGSTAWT